MSNGENFYNKSNQDSQAVVKYLQSVIDGIQKGQIKLASEGEQILLNPPAAMKFRVKAKKLNGKSSVSIKMSWSEQAESGGALTIEDGA